MARICSLVSASSSILLCRLSKIFGSIIPEGLAMVVEREMRTESLGLPQRRFVMELEGEAPKLGGNGSSVASRQSCGDSNTI